MISNEIIYLIAYMFIYSFLGWVLESVFKSLRVKEWVNSGFLIGPLCPIYGFGAWIIYFTLNGLKDNIFILFIAGFVILSIWEYIVGILLEKLFKVKYWDYTDNKFNFQGRLCLSNSLTWGILGVVFINFLHPNVQNVVNTIPTDILFKVEIFVIIIFIVDVCASIIKVKNINIDMDKLAEITDTLKNKMEELKTLTGKANEKSREKLSNIIEELKQKQDSMKKTITKSLTRMKLAFPSMKSEKITKLLSRKIDIFDRRKNDKK